LVRSSFICELIYPNGEVKCLMFFVVSCWTTIASQDISYKHMCYSKYKRITNCVGYSIQAVLYDPFDLKQRDPIYSALHVFIIVLFTSYTTMFLERHA
jgi:hypothetical protein